ncbi:dihydrofolate reductase [Loktanella sp. F6476L]|uniref:dihydrofolate reductase n=1 Tax=Loktanella sp. F6476L TaxID=2926405 RepID=UPI001FF40C72|nr:dihydrofolate reductase [Loktanella sp. F6476L]MCK0119122.1 dihydrofolate reductase [Loktanella sp. F6476L]
MITLIVARAKNNAIGRDGDMPWHLPEDLAMFQRETRGGAVIMGRRTWDSLPEAYRPLKGRHNVVVTRSALDGPDDVVGSIEAAIAACQAAGYTRVYGIGGAGIYGALLPLADRLLITEVDLTVPDADTFFPTFDETEWRQIGQHVLRTEGPACVLRELVK